MTTLIVARTKKGFIGLNDKLLWSKLKGDMRFFKSQTTGNTLVIGRKTFEGMGKRYLKDRLVYVLSNNPNNEIFKDLPDNYRVIGSVESIKEVQGDLFIAGGESVYKQYLPICDKLLITEVDADIEGDTSFKETEYIADNYYLKMTTYHFQSEENDYPFAINQYFRNGIKDYRSDVEVRGRKSYIRN